MGITLLNNLCNTLDIYTMERLKSSAEIKIGEYYVLSQTSLYRIADPDKLSENKIYCRIFNDVLKHQLFIVYLKNKEVYKNVIVDDFLTIEFILKNAI